MGRLTAALLTLALVLGGCGSSSTGPKNGGRTSITVAMGFFAGVQFAPYYVALANGYYRKAGLDVHFRYGIEPDLVRLASTGKVDFVLAGGDEVLAAGARGLHIHFLMTQYSRFPSAVFALRSTGIRTPSNLRGHTVGVPGLYGASYVGLLALLDSAGVPSSQVSIKSIGFTQAQTVAQRKVDSAVGYAMNEPVQLQHNGSAVSEIDVYKYANLAGAGLATGDEELQQHPQVVRAFIAATVRGLGDTLQHPDGAFRVSESLVKGIKAQERLQRDVLARSLDFWRPEPGHPLGWIDPYVWSRTAHYLYKFRQIPKQVSASNYYTNRFIPNSKGQ